MTPHYADDLVTLYHGDCLDVLRALPDASVDAVVTDPPYGLGFMGKEWDDAAALASRPPSADAHDIAYPRTGKGPKAVAFDGAGFHAWCETWAAECLRVLKPGGHLLAFGGTRTWHRLACAVEDAGFEVRDSIAWLYAQGFPKSLDVSKAIDKAAGATREVGTPGPYSARWQGWGTALKPAFEPVVVARKLLVGTVAANVLTHGTGALNVDGCRVGTSGGGNACPGGISYSPTKHPVRREGDFGRWPANVVLDDSQAAELDRQSGVTTAPEVREVRKPNASASSSMAGAMGPTEGHYAGSSGGASRFFPTFRYEAKAPTVERPRDGDVAHPTVKPLDLMRWLVRLVTPPGGVVLEPFAGSGTTAEACVVEGFRCIAIEREPTYLPLIVARLTKPIQQDMFGGAA